MHENQNQTSFANQEPFLEDMYVPQKPEMPEKIESQEDLDATSLAAKRKKKMIVIGLIVVGIVLLAGILGLAVMVPNKMQGDQDTVTIVVPEEQPESITRTERELTVLKERLDEIDPTREYLTVPPVNYDLRLE